MTFLVREFGSELRISIKFNYANARERTFNVRSAREEATSLPKYYVHSDREREREMPSMHVDEIRRRQKYVVASSAAAVEINSV